MKTPGKVVASIPGMVVALKAFPVYAFLTNSRKKKYASEIMSLSDSLMHEFLSGEHLYEQKYLV